MNKDIRLAVNYLDHPKTKRLRRRLGAEAVLAHIALMCFAAKYRIDGTFHGMDDAEVEEAAGWGGKPGALVAALTDPAIGLLDRDVGGALALHDWMEHNRYAAGARERSELGRRGADARWNRRTEGGRHAVGNAGSNAEGNAEGNAPAPAPPPSPSPSPSPKGRERGGAGGTRSPRKTPAPETFHLTERLKAWAARKSLVIEDLEAEIDPFLAHHRAKGNTFADWEAAFQTWVNNELKWGRMQPRGDGSGRRTLEPAL